MSDATLERLLAKGRALVVAAWKAGFAAGVRDAAQRMHDEALLQLRDIGAPPVPRVYRARKGSVGPAVLAAVAARPEGARAQDIIAAVLAEHPEIAPKTIDNRLRLLRADGKVKSQLGVWYPGDFAEAERRTA